MQPGPLHVFDADNSHQSSGCDDLAHDRVCSGPETEDRERIRDDRVFRHGRRTAQVTLVGLPRRLAAATGVRYGLLADLEAED